MAIYVVLTMHLSGPLPSPMRVCMASNSLVQLSENWVESVKSVHCRGGNIPVVTHPLTVDISYLSSLDSELEARVHFLCVLILDGNNWFLVLLC